MLNRRTSALAAGVVLVFLYLPGQQPYYNIPAAAVAKTYSNSMMAVLNSRIKPVSNASGPYGPLWNELVQSTGTISSIRRSNGPVVRRDDETGSGSSFPSVPGAGTAP